MFKDKVVIVTGGANGIGRCIADEFRSQGAVVYVIDKQEGEHFVGDISQKEVLEAFASDVLSNSSATDDRHNRCFHLSISAYFLAIPPRLAVRTRPYTHIV